MNSTSPFRTNEVSDDHKSIRLYGTKGATWNEMNAWLEKSYHDDPHYTWRGFGTAGEEDFCVVLVRKGCAKWVCDYDTECENCGVPCCKGELTENDDEENVCSNCLEDEEASDNDE